MKNFIKILSIILLGINLSMAQNVPSGMKYQAVARNTEGVILPNKPITMRIELKNSSQTGSQVYYVEEHKVTTNQIGLFDLVVGAGKATKGKFNEVPWSTEDVWMAVSIKENGKDSDFSAISESKLLAVPYAYYAVTASKLVNGGNSSEKGAKVDSNSPGVPANVWSLQGNSKSNSLVDKLGTTDYQDLVFITNNIERFRITKDGDISINNNLKVGKDTEVGNDLYVKKNVYLNTVSGATINNGPLTVANMSATKLTGTLEVDKATDLNMTLNVDGTTTLQSAATLNNTLTVAGSTSLNNDLTVTDDNPDFVTTINNTNNGDGDGLLIKLGKTHPMWNGSAFGEVPNLITTQIETPLNQIRSWIYGTDSFSFDDFASLIPNQMIAGGVIALTNQLTGQINSALSLPYKIGPYATPPFHITDRVQIAPGVCFGELGCTPTVYLPALDIPSLPVLPQVIAMPAIPTIPNPGFAVPSFPVLNFTNVTNSLTKKNEFIKFVDKADRELGSIRAQSVQDFSIDYFDGQKILDIAAEIIGLDIVDDAVSIIAQISQMVGDYNNIGVEYSSGHGDYAEWLERSDKNEEISFGDIVGVKAGKITKNIVGAEQIMAVSKAPIVLGNMPDAKKITLGNNIAFMGQIPVKVMGAVKAGNYIVAKGNIAGYGVAIHPKNMTVEDYKLVVGRSWDTDERIGPKMVNTVVGVHNNDFLNIISDLQKKTERTNERLNNIEALLNLRTNDKVQAKK